MFFVYIIEAINTGKWYYGFTTDLMLRLEAHNKGLNTSTAKGGPWKYIFQKPFNTKSEALSFERYLKKTRNKKYIQSTFSEYFLK